MGGSADDEAAALAVDANGATDVTVGTNSPDFPTRTPSLGVLAEVVFIGLLPAFFAANVGLDFGC
jgi:hypothetical protein